VRRWIKSRRERWRGPFIPYHQHSQQEEEGNDARYQYHVTYRDGLDGVGLQFVAGSMEITAVNPAVGSFAVPRIVTIGWNLAVGSSAVTRIVIIGCDSATLSKTAEESKIAHVDRRG